MISYSKAQLSKMKYLSCLSDLLTSDDIDLFHEHDEELSRLNFDGVFTLTGQIKDQTVGVVMTDFRVGGGSFSKKNSARLGAFIRSMEQAQKPIVFIINSLGVRFAEGRTVFDSTFSVIADLYSFRKNNLLVTIGLGKALGISALFFAQGHYRMALEGETQLNLTGPEVHKKFFGQVDADFSEFTVADHQFETNSLIHEILPSSESLLRQARIMINYLFHESSDSSRQGLAVYSKEIEQGGLCLRDAEAKRLDELELQMGDTLMEFFSQRSPIVRVYIGKFHGSPVAYLVNPPAHPNNMLTVSAIDKCQAAMDLFRVLKLPIVGILDCPGGDPRKKESDKDAIIKMINLTHDMISYPYRKMGVILGRCFGGSGMFAFPKIFGGERTVAARESQIGVMHKSIIESLLEGAPRLLEKWKQVASTEVATLDDLLAIGTIDAVVDRNQIGREIERFVLFSIVKPKAIVVSQSNESKGAAR
ncbi:MAG: hypothetical protein IPJ84_14760 [Bdellovibrionales bacterium]|nr:hypothetical protein [Bdellovibrionales bacterium]